MEAAQKKVRLDIALKKSKKLTEYKPQKLKYDGT